MKQNHWRDPSGDGARFGQGGSVTDTDEVAYNLMQPRSLVALRPLQA